MVVYSGSNTDCKSSEPLKTPCYVMLCYVMLCYVMLCYVMLCYVMLWSNFVPDPLCGQRRPINRTGTYNLRIRYTTAYSLWKAVQARWCPLKKGVNQGHSTVSQWNP